MASCIVREVIAMKWVVLVFILCFVPSVYGAATVAEIYSAPSEATGYSGSTNSSCQILAAECADTQYSNVVDTYTALGDGSTAGTSGFTLRNASNIQSSYLRLIYDISGVFPGDYFLRVGHDSGIGDYSGRVCDYINDTVVNTSGCVSFNYSETTGDIWFEVDINDLARRTIDRIGRVFVRLYIDTGSEQVTEAYLKRPFSASDFTIIASGVSETEENTRVENTWTVISTTEIPLITNFSCTVERLLDIPGNHADINFSELHPEYIVNQQGDTSYVSVYWDANTSVANVSTGYNYEVECAGKIGDLSLSGFSQFVYINNQRSILNNIQDFFIYIAQILGFLDNIESGGVATLSLFEGDYFTGESTQVVAKVTQSGVPIEDTVCNVSMYYPDVSLFVDNQQMYYTGIGGLYRYNVTLPQVIGSYLVDTSCNGGNLSQPIFGSGVWNVQDSVRMISIT